MRFLVVDDQEDARDLTEATLLSAGYNDILASASGWDALKALDVGRPIDEAPHIDVALLDIVMPEMDGVELCARIRNDPRYADMPIIMVSALGDLESLANAFVAGATDYVTKPVRRIELVARVRAALRLKQELDRRRGRERELLAFLSSWGERRGTLWIDKTTGLLVGEAIEAYLTAACQRHGTAAMLLSVFALAIDRLDALLSVDGAAAQAVLAQVASAVNRLPAAVGTAAAAYRNGMIILAAPELGAAAAREFADSLHNAVGKLRLSHPELVKCDHVTASVAAITGQVRHDVDGIRLLTRVIAGVQQAANAGGNRVHILSGQDPSQGAAHTIWRNFQAERGAATA
jgi:phosphoserine phosphatase RsbU/P